MFGLLVFLSLMTVATGWGVTLVLSKLQTMQQDLWDIKAQLQDQQRQFEQQSEKSRQTMWDEL